MKGSSTMRSLWLVAVLLLLTAGCAVMDVDTRLEFERACELVETEPEQAAQRLTPIVEKHPEVVDVRVPRARAFAALGKHDEAAEDWAFVIHVRADKTEEQLMEAHRGFLAAGSALLGDLPHSLESSPKGEVRDLIINTQTSCTAILEAHPTDRSALLGKASCFYRLGLHHRARPIAKELVQSTPQDPASRYLLNLVREQEVGVHQRSINEFCQLVRCGDPGIERQAATHLTHLAEHPAVPEDDKDNIRGILLRMVRRDQAPEEVVAWMKHFGGAESQRIHDRRLRRQFKEVDTARALNDWQRAWNVLGEMPQKHPEVQRKRASLLEGWIQELVLEGNMKLERHDMERAGVIASRLESLPTATLAADMRGRRQEFLDEFAGRLSQERAQEQFAAVMVALDAKKPDQALALLDAMEKDASAVDHNRIDLLRADALFQRNDHAAALKIFDGLTDLEEPRYCRMHGLLLSAAGRAEEAIPLLENLPLDMMTSDTVLALVTSLAKEGDWEAVLGRLVSRRPLPDRERAIYHQACQEAARKRMRTLNYNGALQLLRSYGEPEDLNKGDLRNVYLEALLMTGQPDEARELLSAGSGSRPFSAALVQLAVERLGEQLSAAERFHLLVGLRGKGDDKIDEQLHELWPQFGSYMPPPGSYSVRFRATVVNAQGKREEPSYTAANMAWDGSNFVITGKNIPKEHWWVKDGVWYRKTEIGTMEIPVQVANVSTTAPRAYKLGATSWSAEVVEISNSVTIDGVSYKGCLRVKLIPDGETEESIILDIAPEMGEVRREVYRNGRLQFVRELMRMTKLNE